MRRKWMWLFVAAFPLAAICTSETDASASPEEDRARLLLSRATYGERAGDLEALLDKGVEKWLDEQLRPERIDDPVVDEKLAGLDTLDLSTSELMKKYPRPTREEREARAREREAKQNGPEDMASRRPRRDRDGPPRVLRELSEAKVVRAVHSERQLQEVMTDFWFNHFNVYARKNRNTLLALPSYERDAIRPHALGRFEDLLTATAQHPAMLFYLDNWINMKDGYDPRDTLRTQMGRRRRARGASPDRERPARSFGINENYARELMELHTLGVDGGYDQGDVVEVARALTGWTVVGPEAARIKARIEARAGRGRVPEFLRNMPEEGSFVFNAGAHEPGTKTVLGERIDAGGLEDGLAVIELLARHPSTARFISTKLAQRFVSDTPSDALVDEMSVTFRKTGGDIGAVVRAMFLSPRFVSEGLANHKVKTPFELVASAARASGADVRGPALAHMSSELGMPLYLCQPPTGYEEVATAWLSAGDVVGRMRFAGAFASGSLPGVQLPARDESVPEMVQWLASPEFQRQ